MACPVTQEGARERSVYFPDVPGGWFDVWTGEHVAGGQRQSVPAPLDTMPMYGRAGGVVALDPPSLTTQTTDHETLTLWAFPGTGTSAFYFDDGISYAHESGDWFRLSIDLADADGIAITVQRQGNRGLGYRQFEWRLPLAGLGDDPTVEVNGSDDLDAAQATVAQDGAWLTVTTRTDVDSLTIR